MTQNLFFDQKIPETTQQEYLKNRAGSDLE
jgi:hypothetical protein